MKRIIQFIIVLFSIAIGKNALGIYTSGPHAFEDMDCLNCHVSIPAEGQKGPLQMRSPIGDICKKCHTMAVMEVLSHPVDFRPGNRKIPQGFPLSYDGKFTCSTCHDIHSNPNTSLGLRSFFLRNKTEKGDFCTKCHEKTNVSHELLLSAHMSRKPKNIITKNPNIDEVSAQCLACHDGINAKLVSNKIMTAENQFCFCPEEKVNHPIGMDYSMSRIKKGSLHPESRLNKAIKLFDGKVGCGTCHNPYSKNDKMLVISNKGSKLCLECHIK